MLCNFTDGVEVQTFVRLEDEERFPHSAYAFLHSSAWHDHYPGDSRFHLDLTHAISLYDTALAPSLVSSRHGQTRRDHRVLGIDEHDTRALLARVRALRLESFSSNSGIDWRAMFHSIRDRYATRLEVLQSVLTEDTPVQSAFILLQTLLAPYRLHSAVARSNGSDTAWATPVFRLCATAATLFAESESVQATLTPSEHLLLTAARETNREICRTLVVMWAEGVVSLSSGSRWRWRAEVDRLMDWLGWAAWNNCRPACVFPVRVFSPLRLNSRSMFRRNRATSPARHSRWRSGPAGRRAVSACLSRIMGFRRYVFGSSLELTTAQFWFLGKLFCA
jgi:hypothetical protein